MAQYSVNSLQTFIQSLHVVNAKTFNTSFMILVKSAHKIYIN